MAPGKLNRFEVLMKPLAERANKVVIERDCISPDQQPNSLSSIAAETLDEAVERIKTARRNAKPVMLSFGAHTIKNGLAPVLIDLIEQGWLTHLATNGAGIIHDWEFAYQGQSSEDVKGNVERGEFGNWHETGFYINLAINIGAHQSLGYGEAIGTLIENEGLKIPTLDELKNDIEAHETNPEKAATAADLSAVIKSFELQPGFLSIPHPHKKFSVQAAAWRKGIPFTSHPMFGHDIIYNHPMNHGALLGRTAERDFLTFAESVTRIDGGVYLSLGSAVMSPMVFEKSFSMAQNLAIQQGQHIDGHYILVADLAKSNWDWRKGEPPEDNPDYYLRHNKSFSRMGGQMRYLSLDNRDFLLALNQKLKIQDQQL